MIHEITTYSLKDDLRGFNNLFYNK